jgi:hypothetical protein
MKKVKPTKKRKKQKVGSPTKIDKAEQRHNRYVNSLADRLRYYYDDIRCNVEYGCIDNQGNGELDLICTNSKYQDIYEVKSTSNYLSKAKKQLRKAQHYFYREDLITRLYVYTGHNNKLRKIVS